MTTQEVLQPARVVTNHLTAVVSIETCRRGGQTGLCSTHPLTRRGVPTKGDRLKRGGALHLDPPPRL